MTITNIMHVTGSKADLYSSSYFKKVEGIREPVNPFTEWVDGRLYAFGTRVVITKYKGQEVDRYTERIALDLTAAKEGLGLTGESDDPMQEIEDKINENEVAASQYLTSNPPIPPSNSHIDWKYQYQIREHQFSSWVVDPDDSQSGRWKATTEEETQWLNDNGEVIPAETNTHTTSQSFFHYYFLNKYDYPVPYLIDLDVFVGEDLETWKQCLKAKFEEKYPRWAEEHGGENIVIELFNVDVRKAHRADLDTEHDDRLMGYWLAKIEKYPKMISVDQNLSVVASYGSHTEPNMEGDYEYRHALHDAVFSFKKKLVNLDTTLPFCNGLCCYPRIINGKIYASEGQRLSYNEKDRNRRWVLVDFAPIGGCQFIHLSELQGVVSELIMPDSYDPKTQSVLMSIRGRLFLPDEFEIVDGRLLFNLSKFSAIYELDRMLCRGDFTDSTTVLEQKKVQVRKVVKSGVSSVSHDPEETIGDTEGKYYIGDRTFVQYPNGRQQIDFFKKTLDATFKDGKQYYVLFNEQYVAVDVPVGESTTDARTVGIVDSDNVHKSMVHASDMQILFNEFYEDFTEFVPVFERGWDIEVKEQKLDLKNDDNSFLIIINNPGLQIVKHKCFEGPRPFTKQRWGSDSHAGLMRIDFDRQARGLIFDSVTRSVIDYTRETQTLTFYADKCRKWGIANCYINWPTPIAVMDESSHNLMSARGFTLDDANTFKYDHVVWPNLSILDFIFRG